MLAVQHTDHDHDALHIDSALTAVNNGKLSGTLFGRQWLYDEVNALLAAPAAPAPAPAGPPTPGQPLPVLLPPFHGAARFVAVIGSGGIGKSAFYVNTVKNPSLITAATVIASHTCSIDDPNLLEAGDFVHNLTVNSWTVGKTKGLFSHH